MDPKFIIWNEFTSFLCANLIDVAFISETWLKDNDTFSIPNYLIYRADRLRGGVALLIRSSVPHSKFSCLSYDNESMNTLIMDSMKQSIPIFAKCMKRLKQSEKLRNLIKHRDDFRNLYQRTSNEADHASWIYSHRLLITFLLLNTPEKV